MQNYAILIDCYGVWLTRGLLFLHINESKQAKNVTPKGTVIPLYESKHAYKDGPQLVADIKCSSFSLMVQSLHCPPSLDSAQGSKNREVSQRGCKQSESNPANTVYLSEERIYLWGFSRATFKNAISVTASN